MPAEQGVPRRGMLTLEQLRVAVAEGEIDTVVLAFTDMQGRLAGKRLSAEFFLEEVAEHYSEGCNYLLAVDVDMNTVDGYAMSSWDRGYGDFVHYHLLARGALDVVIESDIDILDIAAVSVIVGEAGGTFTDLDGKAVSLETESVLASNGLLHAEVASLLGSASVA